MVFSITLLVCLVYLPFIKNPLIFDDLVVFYQYGPTLFTDVNPHFQLRWLSYQSLKWTWDLFSDIPDIHRLGNMIIHLANGLLLFFLCRSYLRITNKDANTKIQDFGPWLVAMIFVCNPVSVYAVGYLVQRSILLATFFTLLMQLAFLHGLIKAKNFPLFLAVLFYGAAVFSKEHAITAILTLPIIYLLVKDKAPVRKSGLLLCIMGCVAIATYAYLLAKGVLGRAYEHDASMLIESHGLNDPKNLSYLSVVTQAGLFFKYLFLWCIPNPAWMSIDMRATFSDPDAYLSHSLRLGAFITYGLGALYLLVRNWNHRILGFALLYPWLYFLIEFSTIRIQEPFVLYRSYLWIPGLLLSIPVLLENSQVIATTKRKIIVGFALILVLVPLSWNRLWVFSDNYRLWNDAVSLLSSDSAPGAARIFYNRGKALQSAEKWEESIKDFERVTRLAPHIDQAQINIGYNRYNMKLYQDALMAFDRALLINPDSGNAHFGKGLALRKLKDDRNAIAEFDRACGLKHPTACILRDFISKSMN